MADDDRGYRYGAPPQQLPDLSQLNQGEQDYPIPNRNPNGGSAFPGRQPGETREDYNDWYDVNAPMWGELMALNAGREDELQGLLWTYRLLDARSLTNILVQNGFNLGAGGGGGGGRGGGGGGGGGATKEQQYASAEAAVRNRAGVLGLTFDDAAISSLAKAVVDGNWSSDQLDDYLIPAAQQTNEAGLITSTVRQIQQAASNQLLRVSDATAREWAARIASSEMDMNGVQSLLQAQAVQRYGWAASQISQGIGVRDLLLPTRDRIADELELDPESIDLMDDRWMSMVQTVDSNGTTRAATDSEAIMRARQQPEWSRTRKAGDMVATMALTLRDYFGG